ncbi:MAG: internalization-related competence protein ComEC/Rec2, partial [Evtepia sp.]|nr:internalization-related competence protein ComEC/Rec2 [Evtepia sp.]
MRKLALFSAAFAIACLFSLHIPALLPGILGALFLCAFFMLHKTLRQHPRILWISLGFSAGFLWFLIYSFLFYFPAQQLNDRTIQMDAVVTDWPQKTEYGISVPVRGGETGGRTVPMLLYLEDSFSTLRPGDRVHAIAHCTPSSLIHGKELLTFRSKGIYLFARTYGSVTVTPAGHISPRYYPVLLAEQIRKSITKLYTKDAASLQYALLTGWQRDLSEEDQSAFSRTGLSHVVSVSGMHISFLSGALLFLLGKKKKSTVIIQIIVIFFFATVTGNAPGALRAAILCSASLLAPLLGRKYDSVTSLFTALFCLLLLNPFSIANAGLQFSFAATLGIYLFG